jgi:hypothetical protein
MMHESASGALSSSLGHCATDGIGLWRSGSLPELREDCFHLGLPHRRHAARAAELPR